MRVFVCLAICSMMLSGVPRVAAETKTIEQTIADCDQAIADNPTADNYFKRGRAYSTHQDWDSALADYTRAVEINPSYSEALRWRGETYERKRDSAHAILDYNKAVEVDPKNWECYLYRGVFYQTAFDYRRDSHDYDASLADLNKAIELAPAANQSAVVGLRGDLYFAKLDYARALADYNYIIQTSPKTEWNWQRRGEVYLKTGKADLAIADLTKAIELNPRSSSNYNGRAQAYYLKRLYDQAWTDINKVKALGARPDPELITKLTKATGRTE